MKLEYGKRYVRSDSKVTNVLCRTEKAKLDDLVSPEVSLEFAKQYPFWDSSYNVGYTPDGAAHNGIGIGDSNLFCEYIENDVNVRKVERTRHFKLPKASGRFECRVTRLTVQVEGEAIFHPSSTDISIEDEAAGEFVSITQKDDRTQGTEQTIRVSDEDWPVIRDAVEAMISQCRM